MSNRKLIALTLAAANLAIVSAVMLPAPAAAQGTNKEPVAKTKKAAPCPSGWSTTMNNETDTSMCFPQGTLSPKIYAKKESESCASGYYEVYGVWCSTKKP
jgi:invasion protein IalB